MGTFTGPQGQENEMTNWKLTTEIQDAIDACRSLRWHTATVTRDGDDVLLRVVGDQQDTVTHGKTREAINALIDICVPFDRLTEVRQSVTHSGNSASVWVRGLAE
jgi:hypothetical protein